MSDLLTEEEQNAIAEKFFGEISTNELRVTRGHYEIILPCFLKAQSAKTKKGLVEWLQERTYGFDDGSGEVVYKTVYEKGEWQALKKEVEDGS